jgi:molybdopterin converting factor small subunit
MPVIVRFQAQLRHAAQVARLELPCERPLPVEQLLQRIEAQLPHLVGKLVDANGHKRPTLLVFVGDTQATRETIIEDAQEVTLMTPIAGGC